MAPCSDGQPRYGELYEKVDLLTAMLCHVLTIYDPAQLPASDMTTRVRKWWGKHQEQDRQRLEREREEERQKEAKKSAIAKLTPEERRALGIR